VIDVAAEVERALARADVDGVVVGVSVAGERVVLARGVWADGAPASAESTFYAASLTKQLVGLLVAMSVERGELGLHDPARRWLPALPSWAADVTVEALLHHTAGVPRRVGSARGPRTTKAVLHAVARPEALDAVPGTRFAYSNDGYVLLALVLESATGMPIERLAELRVFLPLDMRASALRRSPLIRVADEPAPPATIGDGGWWTSIDDVLTLLVSLGDGRWDPAARRLTGVGTLADGEATDYAWGVRVIDLDGVCAISHGGSWHRWQSKTLRLPALDLAIVVAARTADGQAVSDLATAVASRVIGARGGPPARMSR